MIIMSYLLLIRIVLIITQVITLIILVIVVVVVVVITIGHDLEHRQPAGSSEGAREVEMKRC